MNKNSYIKERLQKDQLISKKAEDVFNDFLKGDFIMDEKIVKKEEKRIEPKKKSLMKRMLATAASLVIVFGMANVYASTQGYGNVFFMIKYLVTGEKTTISDKDEILSDRDISISYEPIKLTENIRMQIRNLQVKDNEAKLIIAVNESKEDSSVVPLNYKVYNSSNELLCEQKSKKDKRDIEYTEELILDKFKEDDNILILEVYKANNDKISKITIDLQSRDITVEGEAEALKKVSEIELKKYLGVVSEYNGAPKGEEGKIKYAQAIFNEIKGESENNVDEINNMLESLGIEKVSDSFTKFEDYKKTTKNGTSYYEVINGWDEYPYTVLDITDMSYCDGLYTATFTYTSIPDIGSFDTDYSNIEKYEATVYFRVNDDDKYSKFRFVKYEEGEINTSVKAEKSNLSGDWKFVSAKLDGKKVELSEVFGSGLRYGECNLSLNSDGTFELNMPGVSSSEFSNNGKYTVNGNEIALKYSDNRTENLIYNKDKEEIEKEYGDYVLRLNRNDNNVSKENDANQASYNNDVEKEAYNYDVNLDNYLGDWYESLEHYNDINPNKLTIKNIENNKLTMDLYITRTAQFDNFESTVNGNTGTFEAITDNGTSSDGKTPKINGKIEFSNNTVKVTVLKSNVIDLEAGSEYKFTYNEVVFYNQSSVSVTVTANQPDLNDAVRECLSNYLELYASSASDTLLEKLTQKGKINYDSNNNRPLIGGVITNVKFADYKKAMLEYVSEKEFEKNWHESQNYKESSTGYLIKSRGIEGYREYTIMNISQISGLSFSAETTSIVDNDESLKRNENITFSVIQHYGYVMDTIEINEV